MGNRAGVLPLSRRYRDLRVDAFLEDRLALEQRGIGLGYSTVPDPLQASKDPSVETQVLHKARLADEQALELLGFRPDQGELPDVAALTSDGFYDQAVQIGATLTRVSEAASLWTDLTKHTSFGLEPVYKADRVGGTPLYLPGLDQDGIPFPLGDPRRADLTSIPIPEQDAAIAHWMYLNDPVEVRKRGEQAKRDLVRELSDLERHPLGSSVRLCGVGCGAARSDLEALEALVEERPDLEIQLDLLDLDHGALRLAEMNIERGGWLEFEPGPAGPSADRPRRARSRDGRVGVDLLVCNITDVDDVLRAAFRQDERGYDFVEAIGTIEYFSDERDDGNPQYPMSGVSLLNNMKAIARQRGVVEFGHMTTHHNVLRILSLVGWRNLKPKSMLAIAEMVAAVFPEDRLELCLLCDFSYLFVRVRKA